MALHTTDDPAAGPAGAVTMGQPANEQPLHGGSQTIGIVRVGETVRRPRHARSEYVQDVLRLLEERGFSAAPRARGFDDDGREVVTFIEGDVPSSGPPYNLPDRALCSAARLIRRFHDATQDSLLTRGREIVAHGDLGPHNTVFRGSEAVGIIDFDDGVGPGSRADDLAHAVWCFADVTDATVPVPQQAHRIALMCTAYGGEVTPRDVVMELVARFERARDQHLAADRAGGVTVFADLLAWLSQHGESLVSVETLTSRRTRWQTDPMHDLHITDDAEADALLSTNPLALLIGMLLDQQVPMETAFGGPLKIQGRTGSLDAATIASADPEAFKAAFSETPAVHRFPGSMAERTQALCAAIAEDWDDDASQLWTRDDPDGATVLKRLKALPGFGEQKAKIFLALLGKQYGYDGAGWREASAPYGEEGSFRSVADIVSPDSLTKVREFKKAAKAAAKEAK